MISRLPSLLPVAILAFLVGLTWWLNRTVETAAPRQEFASPSGPDVTIDAFTARMLGKDGSVRYTLRARRMQGYTEQESADLTDVHLQSTEPGQPLLTAQADAGQVAKGGDEILLKGNVVMTRAATANDAALTVRTGEMRINSEEGTAFAPGRVEVKSDGMEMVGRGLTVKHAQRAFELQEVRGTLEPRRKTSP